MQLNVWLLGSEYIEQPSSPLELHRHYLQEFQHISETQVSSEGNEHVTGWGALQANVSEPAKVPAGK